VQRIVACRTPPHDRLRVTFAIEREARLSLIAEYQCQRHPLRRAMNKLLSCLRLA
jgi:hypothetical protein